MYGADGRNIGYFIGDAIYGPDGRYIGEVYGGDRIGRRTGVAHPVAGARAALASRGVTRLADTLGMPVGGWDEPSF